MFFIKSAEEPTSSGGVWSITQGPFLMQNITLPFSPYAFMRSRVETLPGHCERLLASPGSAAPYRGNGSGVSQQTVLSLAPSPHQGERFVAQERLVFSLDHLQATQTLQRALGD